MKKTTDTQFFIGSRDFPRLWRFVEENGEVKDSVSSSVDLLNPVQEELNRFAEGIKQATIECIRQGKILV